MKNRENWPGTLNSHKNQPRTMKNWPGTLNNHKNWPRTMKNHKTPAETVKTSLEQPKTNLELWKPIKTDLELWKTKLKPGKPIKADMEPWKTNLEFWKPWKLTWSCTGGLWMVNRWLQKTPRRKWSFFFTNKQTLHHNVYITMITWMDQRIYYGDVEHFSIPLWARIVIKVNNYYCCWW